MKFLYCLAIGAVLTASAANTTPLIPTDRFFEQPAIAQVKISPDGRHVAFLAPVKERLSIALMDLTTGKVEPLVVPSDENIGDFFWKGSDYIVYGADVGGNESPAIQSINIKTRRIVRLLESFGRNNATRQDGQWGGVAFYWSINPTKIIVRGSRDKNSWFPGLYAVDVATGTRSEIGGDTGDQNQLGVVFDNSGMIRVQYLDTHRSVEARLRLGADMKFTPVRTLPRDSYFDSFEHGVILADNQTLLFVDYEQHDRGAVVAWDMETGKQKAELFVPPEGEITSLILGRDKRKLLGVIYEADKQHVHWLDSELAAVQAALDKLFPDTFNIVTDWSDDRKRFLVVATSDVESGVNFILDRSGAQPRLMPLGSARPNLPSAQLARMQPVHFAARDGLQLQGYLTRPAGANGPGPLILHPHGGPYGIRDSWGYNADVQFLVSRGYSVLQVNYRGSGGFGRKFLEAGRLEWGRKMQDDLTDSVQWAVHEGIADPKKVAIYGASYGGYAAMAGAAFTPDLYRCAINYVGAVDLTMLQRRDQNYYVPRVYEMFMDKWVHPDFEELKRRSPVNYVANIKIPTLHAYGENDPRVEWRVWKKLKAELERNRIPYESLNQEDQGHGFHSGKASVDFHTRLEEFLKKHLPVSDSAPAKN